LRHVDVGSRLDGFVGHLSVFREVDVIDIRPQPIPVHNVRFHQLDLMSELPAQWISATDSLSCLHTIEHFGLGRYGDPLDINGHLRGLERLKQLVQPGGILYLSTPIGPERIEFNAHRVFSAKTVIDWFQADWTIENFAVIDDSDHLHENIVWTAPDVGNHFGCHLGVGLVAARRNPTKQP
jgi:SAM-dependent methyltransferase